MIANIEGFCMAVDSCDIWVVTLFLITFIKRVVLSHTIVIVRGGAMTRVPSTLYRGSLRGCSLVMNNCGIVFEARLDIRVIIGINNA